MGGSEKCEMTKGRKNMTQQLVKKGQQISLKIKRLGINGEGIGYHKCYTKIC